MTNTFQIRVQGTDLASRSSAAALRSAIESQLHEGVVTLDISEVQSLSESYADELLGVLIHHYGLEWVFSRLKIVGANKAVINSVTQAIRYRLEIDAGRPVSAKPINTVIADAVKKHELVFG